MKARIINILISGVGGQGILLASKIAAAAFLEAGHDVKTAAALGMAQRGGAVCSHIRIGRKVYSPLISRADADILIGMELAEAFRYIGYLKEGGLIILLDREIRPSMAASESYRYPKDLKSKIKKNTKDVLEISFSETANELKNIKTANIFLLGVLSDYFSLNKECWLRAIEKEVPPQLRDSNLYAFELGRSRSLKAAHRKFNL